MVGRDVAYIVFSGPKNAISEGRMRAERVESVVDAIPWVQNIPVGTVTVCNGDGLSVESR